MSNPSIEKLTDPTFASDLASLSLQELRIRRGQCQDAEEVLSLQRRMVQGRLDIVQAEQLRRSGGGEATNASAIVESLPDILVEHGDRHLGPGRLVSIDTNDTRLGPDFDEFAQQLDSIVDGTRLSQLTDKDDAAVSAIADELDRLERSISENRHKLHKHIDQFQAEVVRRYKTGEASVEGLLES